MICNSIIYTIMYIKCCLSLFTSYPVSPNIRFICNNKCGRNRINCNTCRLIINCFLHTFNTFCRIDHWMWFSLCICIISQINNNISVKLKHISFNIFWWNFTVHSILNKHRCLVC